MSLLGIRLSLLIGETLPRPAPTLLVESLQSVQVTLSDEGHSGFQITFQAGRGGMQGSMDYPLLTSPLLKPFNRVILVVSIGASPFVLFDGLITNQQLSGSSTPGGSSLTITGEDVSYAMDREERSTGHPGKSDSMIVRQIITTYAQYGLIPEVFDSATASNPPNPNEFVPTQQQTDLGILRSLAERYGYVFFVKTGEVPGTNIAYWGPPPRTNGIQRAITLNMGSASNVESVNFQYDALTTTLYRGNLKDPRTGQVVSIHTENSMRPPPPLASQPAINADRNGIRINQYRASGPDTLHAQAHAQGLTDASTDRVLTASGELDATRYGDVLQPRSLVGLRGAGYSFDGLYYVKSVTHNLKHGEYKQQFSLTREGKGSTIPVVRT